MKTMDTSDVRKRPAVGGVDTVLSKSPDEFAAFLKVQRSAGRKS